MTPTNRGSTKEDHKFKIKEKGQRTDVEMFRF